MVINTEVFRQVNSPAYVVSEELLIQNLEILKDIQDRSGGKILLALKAFAMHSLGDLISQYLSGVCASGLWEARLGKEFFQGEVHTYSPAFKQVNFEKAASFSSHICVNSISQWRQISMNSETKASKGIRINPELKQGQIDIYDPCVEGSRLGVLQSDFMKLWNEEPHVFEQLEGIHFHALCQHNASHLKNILDVIDERWSAVMHQVKWVNFGGGHHLTHESYDRELLIALIQEFRTKYQVEVYMEPGEAIVYQAGFLVSEVVDVVSNHGEVAILDVSCTSHMPDVLEMPYRPGVMNGYELGIKDYSYRLGGNSCLSGDLIGEWSFDQPLQIGDQVVFEDMAQYTMVKSTTFNGVIHPDICILNRSGEIQVVKHFEYDDFKNKLS